MKQVLFLAITTLVLYQTSARGVAKDNDELERRLRDLTESEQPLMMDHSNACPLQVAMVGCYKDTGSKSNKVLNELMFTDRDPSSPKSSGKTIDWHNFPDYLNGLICRCAQASKAKGFTHFGVQYYGECWSKSDAGRVFARDGKDDNKCVNGFYRKCNPHNQDQNCVGKAHANEVYKIVEEGSGGGEVGYAYDA